MLKKIKNIWIRIYQNIDIRVKNAKKQSPATGDDIVVLNTAIDSDNLGDEIIMHYYAKALEEIVEVDGLYNIATHTYPSEEDVQKLLMAKYVLIIGTNILSPKMELYSGWRFDNRLIKLRNVILIGAGWWGNRKPSFYSKYVYKNILSKNIVHSVRDKQTKTMLGYCGIVNTINTNCLTMMGLEKKCKDIPKKKSDEVIFTITGVNNDIENDKKILNILRKNYRKIFFWPQANIDLQYLKSFDRLDDIEVIERNLESYTEFLREKDNLDYVGTRLHGGIHALQNGKRAIIIAVDNRAVEISKDTGLIVIKDKEIDSQLEKKINSDWETKITVNTLDIKRWLNGVKKINE